MSNLDSESRFQRRQTRLYEILTTQGFDSLALNAGPSITYLTGLHFHLSERPVVALFRPGFPPAIVLPELEAGKVEGIQFPLLPYTYGEDPQTWEAAFKEAVTAIHIEDHTIGVEIRRMRMLEHRFLASAAPHARFSPAEGVLAELRMVKDEVEIQAMRKAVEIAQLALEDTLQGIKPGISEKQIAAELTIQLLRHGSAPEFPFSPIVAAGQNSANPHATPTNRKLSVGDLLIIDWGASHDGYFSDLTRTFAIGSKPDADLV
ncbi:MAG: M24 family metallopeptidase, partial [Anaerolineales bacterium]